MPATPIAAPSTQVISNGSGLVQDLEALIDALGRHELDPSMNEIWHEGFGMFRFAGNFRNHSHVFNVRTNDSGLAARLFTAMVSARARPTYVEAVARAERAAADYHALLQSSGNAEAYREARREWAATRPPTGSHVKGDVSLELLAQLTGGLAQPQPKRRARP